MKTLIARAALTSQYRMFCLALAFCAPWPASAQTSVREAPPVPAPPTLAPQDKPSASARPRLRHTPRVAARNDGAAFAMTAHMEREWLVAAALLHYRPLGGRAYTTVRFERARDGSFVALVPEPLVTRPGFEYWIELEQKDGVRRAAFASAAEPQPVRVTQRSSAALFAERLARHRGAQHDFALAFRFVNTGALDLGRDGQLLRDSWNQLDLGYTHRVLSSYLHSIHFGFGIVGAGLGVSRPKNDLGLDGRAGVYFGRARATWEWADLVGLDVSLVLGANQQGFVVGGGGTLRLGRIAGTHFDVGAEYIQTTGYDVWFEFAFDTVPGFMLSLRADLTSWASHRDGMAVIPSFNAKWWLPRGFYATASLSYGTRDRAVNGGLGFSTGLGYQF